MSTPIRVLLVEDNPGDADLIREMLPSTGDSGFSIQCVTRMTDAVSYLSEKEVDLALLDLNLPDSQGIDTVLFVRRAAPKTPIVVLTGQDDEQIGTAAVQSGAQDYLVKGQTPGRHLSRVLRYAIQRKQAEEQVRESERFLRSALDALSAHIAIIDATGKVLAVNKAWQQFAEANGGHALRCYRNINYFEACKAAQIEETEGTSYATTFAAGIQAVLSGEKELFEIDYPLYSSLGEFWFHGRVTPFPGKDVRRAVVAHENISDRKRTEEEKIQLVAQLRQAQKIEAIGTLAGGIAHDFNNILSSVLGFTELTLQEIGDDSSLAHNLKEVYQAGMRAKELVEQILTFARKDEGRIQPTRASAIAKEASKLIRSTIPAAIDIELNVESEAFVMADPAQLHQIFMNLFTNAAHAMEADGGKLTIGITEARLDRPFDSMQPVFKPGNYVQIRIADTGTGIPQEKLHKIFDPYFTTKSRGEGTGLGLSVVHGIVKSYGGEIFAKSRVGKGTTFSVYLPLAQQHIDVPVRTSPAPPKGTERILFVDDELPIAKMNQQMLNLLGYQVTILNSSIEALERISQGTDEFDLIITDMNMPQMSGDQLALAVRKIKPNLPIILCTGYSKKLSPEKAKAIGVDAFLMKPVSTRDMAETIRRVLDDKGLGQFNRRQCRPPHKRSNNPLDPMLQRGSLFAGECE